MHRVYCGSRSFSFVGANCKGKKLISPKRNIMNIYEKLGIKTGINACGTVTRLGGTRLAPEVTGAMAEAAGSFVPMHEFHVKAGEYAAKLLDVEACCITCGAAAGLAISAAACMTRKDSQKVLQLPDTTGMPNEVLMLKAHRILYDQALCLSGAVIHEVGTKGFTSPELLEAEISKKTALFLYVAERESENGSIPLPDIVPILKRYGVPIAVDAAAELPPAENIRSYLDMGADLVIFSGGKEFRGPQASGLILGNKELIDACNANCCPNYSIGRAMKISKENVAGLIAAVEIFANKDYDGQIETWENMTREIYKSFEGHNDVQTRTGYPAEPGVQPAVILRTYIKPLKMTAAELQAKLLNAPTPVFVDINSNEIVLNPQCVEPGELEPLIKTLRQCLDET